MRGIICSLLPRGLYLVLAAVSCCTRSEEHAPQYQRHRQEQPKACTPLVVADACHAFIRDDYNFNNYRAAFVPYHINTALHRNISLIASMNKGSRNALAGCSTTAQIWSAGHEMHSGNSGSGSGRAASSPPRSDIIPKLLNKVACVSAVQIWADPCNA